MGKFSIPLESKLCLDPPKAIAELVSTQGLVLSVSRRLLPVHVEQFWSQIKIVCQEVTFAYIVSSSSGSGYVKYVSDHSRPTSFLTVWWYCIPFGASNPGISSRPWIASEFRMDCVSEERHQPSTHVFILFTHQAHILRVCCSNHKTALPSNTILVSKLRCLFHLSPG